MSTCKTCGGPAYVGLATVECINPKCEPIDPRSIPVVRRIFVSMPIPADGCVPLRSVEHKGEHAWGVECWNRAVFTHVRGTLDECIDAWVADNAELIANESARRAARALYERMTSEQCERANTAYLGRPADAGACFYVEDWNRFAWCCWEATR